AHILELIHQVGNEGRNAVQGLRPQDGDSLRLEQAFAAIEREFTEAGGGPDAQLQVTVKGRSRPLHPVFRDDVYRIGREAVINAFRHSGAKTINVEIEYHDREFRLVVRSEEHTSELQSRENLVCRLLLEKKNRLYSTT